MFSLEDLWLFSGKLPADLLYFLFYFSGGFLNNEILLPPDRLLVLAQPLP